MLCLSERPFALDVPASTAATLLILTSALLHAAVNSLIRGRDGDVMERSVTAALTHFALLPAVFFLPWPRAEIWLLLGASVLAHLGYQHCLIAMYRRADLTLVYPVARGIGPLGVAVWSWGVMGLWPGLGPFTGVTIIILGIFSMAASAAFMRRQGAEVNSAALLYACGTGLGIAAYTLIDAAGVKSAGATLSYIAWLFVLHGAMMLTYGAVQDRQAVRAIFKGPSLSGLAAGIGSMAGYGIALLAFSMGDTAELSALRETSIVFALIIGAVFLQERVTAARAMAATLIAAGAIIIRAF